MINNFLETPQFKNLDAFIRPNLVEQNQKQEISRLQTDVSLKDEQIVRL